MSNPSNSLVRALRRDRCLHLVNPRHLCVRAERGTLWITVDGELQDIQLDAGQSRVFDGRIKVLVSSIGGDAVLSITPLRQSQSLAGRWARWARWSAWLAAAPRLAVPS